LEKYLGKNLNRNAQILPLSFLLIGVMSLNMENNYFGIVGDFGFPPRSRLELRSFGLLRREYW
jgi:hypothetical protein